MNLSKKCLVIAEAGVNHNGNLQLALQLCDAAKAVGADVIKFQTWQTEKLLTAEVRQASYQTKNTGIEISQFEMLKKLELPYEAFRSIKAYCDKIGILFASTADEEESLDFLIDLGVPFIKVGSGDIANIPFLRYIGHKKMPVLLSTGMSTLEDVKLSINALWQGGATDITLLHCTTNYPCPYNEVNLKAMLTLKEHFNLPVGYSDHTVGKEVALAAVALGACVVEKHFTLDTTLAGPDHAASTAPKDFKKLVEAIRKMEDALGDGIKKPTFSEQQIMPVITKRIVAGQEICQGDVFSEDNLVVKRSERGLPAKMWDNLIGQVATKFYKIDEGIDW
jgi:N-acetylneuraminate synthase/N,N'-diacetyllegionaminate synthase